MNLFLGFRSNYRLVISKERKRLRKLKIIPIDWVRESTQPVAKNLGRFEDRGGYGYLWWISDGIKNQPYYASGNGGQRICVLPESKLVFVHTVNTYENTDLSQEQIENLIGLILEARVAEPQTEPRLFPSTKKTSACTPVHIAIDSWGSS